VAWRIIDARYFNVPQRRRRVFIVAHRADLADDPRVASERALHALRESGSGDPTPGWPPRTDATAGARAGAAVGGREPIAFYYSGGGNDSPSTDGVSPTVKKGSTLDIGSPPAISYRKSKRAQTDQDDESWVEADETNTLNRFDTGDTRATQLIAATLTRGGHPNSNAPGRRKEDDVNLVAEVCSTLQAQHGRGFACNAEMAAGGQLVPVTNYYVEGVENATLRANGVNGGRTDKHPVVHTPNTTVRRLTPVECERLMGWPDDWTAPEGVKAPDSKRYAACGDGIVSWVAYWIGQRIRMIEEEIR
jgi:DNA (cytosine-5)-methyltransferase 1